MAHYDDPNLTDDQNAVGRLCAGLADEDGIEARTGRRWGWFGYNKLAVIAGLHRSLIKLICVGERTVSPATKQAIEDGLDAEIERLRRLRRRFKKAIK